jgi:hypothetical protein
MQQSGEIVEPKEGVTPAPDAPVKLTDAPVSSPPPDTFDFNTVLPDNLPEEFASLRGKTFKDLFDSHQSLRKTLGDRSDKITALEASVQDLQGKVPKEGDKGAQPDLVSTDVWLAIREEYLQTGEVPEEALTAIEKRGVMVDRDTALEFLEWQRFAHDNLAKKLAAHTEGKVTEEQATQVMRWLRSGQSPFHAEELKGFDRMSKRGNLGYFDMVVDEFQKAVQAGAVHPGAAPFGGQRVSGRPVTTPDQERFKSSADFQAQLLNVRRDPKLSPFEKRQKENELIAARKRQHGEA